MQQGEQRLRPNTFLAEQGFCTFSINYRLSQQAPFPAQLEDAKAAVRWVRANAATYHLNPDYIGVWGTSAGGHLAALLGTSADHAELEGNSGSSGYSSNVQAVVDLYGATDLVTGWTEALDPTWVIAQLIGASPQNRTDLIKRASPVTYIREGMPPFLIFHGEQDDTVPLKQSEVLYHTLKSTGNEAAFIPVPNAGHDFGGVAFEHAQQLILAFFTQHLLK